MTADVYVIEVVQINRIVKVKARTPDYDSALASFDKWKTQPCRTCRFLKVSHTKGRILLKSLDRPKKSTPAQAELKSISKGESSERKTELDIEVPAFVTGGEDSGLRESGRSML